MSLSIAVFLIVSAAFCVVVFCLIVIARLDMMHADLREELRKQNPFYKEGKELVEKWERQLNGEKVDD